MEPTDDLSLAPWDEIAWRASRRREPTPEQSTDPWLNAPITSERAFSQRLGQCASAEWQRTWQATLGPLVVDALLVSINGDLGATITPAQRRILARPLWYTIVRGSRAPDIAMIDEHDRIVLVIEVKGPRTQVQWTPLTGLPEIDQWADNATAQEIRDWVESRPPSSLTPHPRGETCSCWALKNAGNGLHAESLHQGDVYYSARDWVPGANPVRSDCVWLALLPSARTVTKWKDGLYSCDHWATASIPALLATLRSHLKAEDMELTTWERARLSTLVDGGEALYNASLPRAR